MPTVCYNPATGAKLGTQRSLLSIYNDLNALTLAKRNAIWADFTSGNPPKWSLDDGLNAGVVMALSVPAIDLTGLTTADQLKARIKMVAAYILDRPLYLVAPAFDGTIDVPGYTA